MNNVSSSIEHAQIDVNIWIPCVNSRVKEAPTPQKKTEAPGRDRYTNRRTIPKKYGIGLEKTTACWEACVQIPVRGFLSGADGGMHKEMVSLFRGDMKQIHPRKLFLSFYLCVCWNAEPVPGGHSTHVHTQSPRCAGMSDAGRGPASLWNCYVIFSSFPWVAMLDLWSLLNQDRISTTLTFMPLSTNHWIVKSRKFCSSLSDLEALKCMEAGLKAGCSLISVF